MTRFKKILCYAEPLERSDYALRRALELAQAGQAQLTLIDIVDEIPIMAPNMQAGFMDIRRGQLEELLQAAGPVAVDVSIQLMAGSLGAIHVIKTVIDEGYDLVIKPSDNAGRHRSILFGSNDLRLLRKCPAPVWIVKPRHRLSRILAAIDVDPGLDENSDLNRRILQLAGSIAQDYASELHIVHAWRMIGEDILRHARSNLPQDHVDQMEEETHIRHKNWLDSWLQEPAIENTSCKVHLIKGEPHEVIAELVDHEGIDLTIMGTLARTGIPGLVIGNTAEKILASLDCSVLAIKPHSFRSPVRD